MENSISSSLNCPTMGRQKMEYAADILNFLNRDCLDETPEEINSDVPGLVEYS